MFALSISEDVARLAMDRPEARNAISRAGWAALGAAVDEVARSPARVLILRGEPGGAFSAGADLSEFPDFSRNPATCAAFRTAMRDAIDAVRDLPIPTVALIEGACHGAGVALALACDLRFAGPGARFSIPPARLGISYPQEDVHALVALIGPGQASRLLFGAGGIDAPEAARIGLAECVGDFEADVAAFAASVVSNDPESIAVLKRGIRLAVAGARQDSGQDRAFDAMLGADTLGERLAAHRAGKR